MLELNLADVHVMTSLMKMKVLSSFTHPHVPNLFPEEHKSWYFEELLCCYFPFREIIVTNQL